MLPAVAALVVLADQLSKAAVMNSLPEGQSWSIASWLTPIVQFTHVTNTGAAFGLFPGLGALFVIVSFIVVVAILLYGRHLPTGRWLTRVALGLQLGGAIGNNLIDRLSRGYVVDFIDVQFWPLHNFPVFNLADTSIVVGVAILCLILIWEDRREQSARCVAETG
ncbi:MAG: signal peptidase II [Chloroflexi bacterium]|nr:signal peptidase II [Chloroflexota bacterium]